MGVKQSLLGKLLGNADRFSDEQVRETITLLISHAVTHYASDIHIEPQERFALVRYRINGILRGVHKLPLASLPLVITQLKETAHLQGDVTDMPQEGHYATLVGEHELEIGVSILPVIGGEKAVLHITRRLQHAPSLEQLGLWGPNLTTLQNALHHTHGLIIIAAPKQHGGTTTLHSMLQLLNAPTISIATVEPLIEYQIPGANQLRVRPHHGLTFYTGLQAVLGQDPNVIALGSIPDRQTGDLTVQAATSGHLVIANLHADNAATALSHIRTLTSEPFLLATSVRAVVSQRLVRVLCANCREQYELSPEQAQEIYRTFGITSAGAHKQLHELEHVAMTGGMGPQKPATTPQQIISLWRASEEGCERCNHSGYSGSSVISEVLVVDEALQKPLIAHEAAGTLHKTALKHGFVPLGLDGLVLALRGQTSIGEVLRVTTAS